MKDVSFEEENEKRESAVARVWVVSCNVALLQGFPSPLQPTLEKLHPRNTYRGQHHVESLLHPSSGTASVSSTAVQMVQSSG